MVEARPQVLLAHFQAEDRSDLFQIELVPGRAHQSIVDARLAQQVI